MSDNSAKILNSKKFYAYCIGIVALLVAGFAKLISADDFSGIFQVLSIGYFGAQGGIDVVKALGKVVEKRRNGSTEDPGA